MLPEALEQALVISELRGCLLSGERQAALLGGTKGFPWGGEGGTCQPFAGVSEAGCAPGRLFLITW